MTIDKKRPKKMSSSCTLLSSHRKCHAFVNQWERFTRVAFVDGEERITQTE